GFAALAGMSANRKKVQILISNYKIPANYKPKEMLKPGDSPTPPSSEPAPTKGIVYRDNSGYDLTIGNLPWGRGTFKIKRYRISGAESLKLVEERTEAGSRLKLTNALPTDTVDLIELQRQ